MNDNLYKDQESSRSQPGDKLTSDKIKINANAL